MSSTGPTAFSLSELCALANLPARTVRYYVQIGLLDRPIGETRAATYSQKHLEQLLQIRKWTAAGLSLERVREILHGQEPPVVARSRAAGSIEVRTHLMVAEGVEVVVEPASSGLSPEKLRRFFRDVLAAYRVASAAEQSENGNSDNIEKGN